MSYAADFGLTLTQHVVQNQSNHPDARGQLSALLTQIGVAGKLISAQVRRAGLIEVWGATGSTNVQGERVQKLDKIANDTFVEVLTRSGCVAGMASEEEDSYVEVQANQKGDYLVVFDPLDGSSNIDVGVSIGTIFGIFKHDAPKPVTLSAFLRPGRELVAAGYIVYGSSTVLTYTAGQTVDCFTLDPASGEFFLTRRDVKLPSVAKILSVNECNAPYWPRWASEFVTSIRRRNGAENRAVSGRHIGSLVVDFHRNLVKGGIYLYPVDRRNRTGKLRLMYECNPLAFIAQVAGGCASNGQNNILDLVPSILHERCGLILGPRADIEAAEALVELHGLNAP
ncbi:MAG: class 1 fructose-bisphosphatase [Myxococcota bacterium]|nr:class 1 fructose-bisphosphatase [Myxococcota bacterium]